MIDIEREINAEQRSVGTVPLGDGEGRVVRIRRSYDSPIEDVWDALTTPERISRWFLPISGDYRLGGRYQLEGNAGGEILQCDRPRLVRVSWVFGEMADAGPASEVVVRLTPAGAASTMVELEHIAIVPDEFWDQFGPGAVGVGWDGAVLGFSLHMRGDGGSVGDPIAWQVSDEGREFFAQSSAAWGVAYEASGADPEAVKKAVMNTTAFYAPEPEGSPS
jgi:uncharacterized protein YndB with AHSA1/START domain